MTEMEKLNYPLFVNQGKLNIIFIIYKWFVKNNMNSFIWIEINDKDQSQQQQSH